MAKRPTKAAAGAPGNPPAAISEPAQPPRSGPLFEGFVAAKVVTLATLLRRSTALRFQRMFGLGLVESRCLMRIGASGPLSLNELADHIGIAKSQTSRVVSHLVSRGLVERVRSTGRYREVELTLTPDGRSIHAALLDAGAIRNQELTSRLVDKDLARVQETLDSLIDRARELLVVDQELSAGAEPERAAAEP